MILVDTNVLSELTRPEPATRVVAWLEVNEPALAVPAIALAELRYGIARLPQGRRRSSLLRFWQTTCDQFRGRIFSFDRRAAEVYGDVAAAAERAGRRLSTSRTHRSQQLHWCTACPSRRAMSATSRLRVSQS